MNFFASSKIPSVKKDYIVQGYSPVAHSGQTGSDIFVNLTTKRVVRFGGDPAFDHFAIFVLNNRAPYFPVIYSHECPDGPFELVSGQWPLVTSVTEMEQLDPLPSHHHAAANQWFQDAWDARKDQKPTPPFNGLEHAFDALVNEAHKEVMGGMPGRKITGADLKVDNVMIRAATGEWVIIDGFS